MADSTPDEVTARIVAAGDKPVDGDAKRVRADVERKLFGSALDPVKVGRYVLLDRVGTGGLGMVYAAYDPKLDRRVALKLLHAGHEDEEARQRLLREARSLAKLAHPNVVAVFDAGLEGTRLFLAMELVVGVSLDKWMRDQKRGWREVFRVLLAAAHGLEAAHRGGIVHRDFKPANVILGDDGRVRVLDFGLARSTAALNAANARPSAVKGEIGADSASPVLTSPNAVVGTPAYMAPEQHRGDAADERSDVYAFCCALYEGLAGARPFAGTTERELARAKEAAPPDLGQRVTGVPRWLVQIASRGLAPEPDQRFRSMQELVAALEAGPRRSRNRRIGAGAIVLAGLVGWQVSSTEQADPVATCVDAPERFSQLWTNDSRATIEAAFTGTGLAYASESWAKAESVLDGYVSDWTASQTRACEATHLKGTQSSAELATRMACLDGRLTELRDLLQAFEAPKVDTVRRAVDAARHLSPVATCDDPDAFRRELPPPTETETRLEVAEIRATIRQARTQQLVASTAEGIEMLAPAVERALDLNYVPVQAEALLQRAQLQMTAGAYAEARSDFEEALRLAELSGHVRVKATAGLGLMWVVGDRIGDTAAARQLEPLAGAWVEGAGGDVGLRVELHRVLGMLARQAGDLERASHEYGRGLALLDDLGDPLSVDAPNLRHNLVAVRYEQGKVDDALELARLASEESERVYGGTHPALAAALSSYGGMLMVTDRRDESRAVLERALKIRERGQGVDHPRVADVLTNLGALAERDGRLDDAVQHFSRALSIEQKHLDPGHVYLAQSHQNLASMMAAQGQPAEALPHFDAAIEIYERSKTPSGLIMTATIAKSALAANDAGNLDGGKQRLARALASEAGLGAADRSNPLYEEVRFSLALALEAVRGDSVAARAMMMGVKQSLESRTDPPPLLGRVDAWLKEHP